MADDDSAPAPASTFTIPANLTADQLAAMQQAVLAAQTAQISASAKAIYQANAASLAILQPGVGVIGGDEWNSIMAVLNGLRSTVSDPDLNAHLDGVVQCAARLNTAFQAKILALTPAP